MAALDRRDFLARALASMALPAAPLAEGAALLTRIAAPQTSGRIDVHHHFGPPTWVAAMRAAGQLRSPDNPMGLLSPANTRWTAEQSLEDLDRGGGAAAVLSITNPGLYLGDRPQAVRLARECNDFGAEVVRSHPTRFGLFAAMPLPDVDATLREIEYAYDQLRADGVGFMTSYEDSWLGDPAYRPVMEELDRRSGVVFVHPTAARCCRGLNYAVGVGPGSMEYGTDTTRAITGVVVNGFAHAFPNIRWIWSHGGGTLPFLAARIGGSRRNAQMPDGFMAEVKKFYYDLAGATNRGVVASLLELVQADHILFGTDFPPGGTMAEYARLLRELDMFSDADLRRIERENAARLLPRLAT
ncbi:MAG TPA: amidohydrolase family protein [Longimicrobiales bacterium]|nr:amidohydrolase family protein [Longimicrobiales bacterium]